MDSGGCVGGGVCVFFPFPRKNFSLHSFLVFVGRFSCVIPIIASMSLVV